MALSLRENSLAALRHERYDFVPSHFDHLMAGFGAVPGPALEKGPMGGGLDGFGVAWIPTASGGGAPVPVPGTHLMDSETIVDWKKIVTIPDPSAYDWASCAAFELTMGNPKEQAIEYGCGTGPFERLVALMGFEEALMALALEPQACYDLMDAVTNFKIECIPYIKKHYHAEIFTHYDDIATQQCTFMDPKIYRQYIKPLHKRLCDAARSYDMIPIQHTCGKADALIEDFIETGAAAWTSVQPTNDIEGILKAYGKHIVISGGYDTTGRPGQADVTPSEVDDEVKRCMETYGSYRGYMFFGFKLVNSIDPKENMASTFQLINAANTHRQGIQVNF